MNKKNLVILCAGNESLHMKNKWSQKGKEFDLSILYYGKDPKVLEEYNKGCQYICEVEGPKWKNIHQILKNNDFWKTYKYIWFPDDDLEVDVDDVNRMFRIVNERNIALSQPSLLNENVSHEGLLHRSNITEDVFETDFIEIQMPCVRVEEVKEIVFKTLEENEDNISGWGFDHYWAKMIREKYIVNSVIVRHTKPVSINSGFYKKYGVNPFEEMKRFKKKYNLN